jgi:hypothetical protein
MLRTLLLTLAASASALAPAIVSVKQCGGVSWAIKAPSTTPPNTPSFDFSVTASTPATNASGWEMSGSLGLPNHPLGVFKFDASGTACAKPSAYILNGVLGRVNISFPSTCQSATSSISSIAFHVDVWTVIPSIPPLVSTGFEFTFKLTDPANAELLCLKVDLSQPPTSGAEKSQDGCLTASTDIAPYPPVSGPLSIPWESVDLDEPAATRWTNVVQPRAEGMKALLTQFIDNLSPKLNSTITRFVLSAAGLVEMKRMPAEFVAEMEGIAKATGIAVGYIWLMNMMYELTGYCTSLVAQDQDGTVYHGRNLDFGIFMGTDAVTHSWKLTQLLRDILVNVRFMRGGQELYNSTTYAGFVGLLSGSRKGAFSITVDTRYDTTLDEGVIGWIAGRNSDCQVRNCMRGRRRLDVADPDLLASS